MFSVHTTPDKFVKLTITAHIGFCGCRDMIAGCHHFQKAPFENVFRPHKNEKPAFSNSSDSKSVLKSPFS